VAAKGTITFVTLDDTGVEIGVVWETQLTETIRVDADSLHAALVRRAAVEVVTQHYAYLEQDGISFDDLPEDA